MLVNDITAVSKLNAERVMVAVPLLYVFMVENHLYRLTIFFRF